MRLDAAKFGPYFGGSTPSSGFLGLYMMLQVCSSLLNTLCLMLNCVCLLKLCIRVTVYGFGLDSENGDAQAYHYFDLFSEGERKKMMNPTHSFDTERYARIEQAANVLKLSFVALGT